MQNEPIEVTLSVTVVLEMLGIPYLIGGSKASTLHGMIRTTQDSDVITESAPTTSSALSHHFKMNLLLIRK